jgi:hypothetical protein
VLSQLIIKWKTAMIELFPPGEFSYTFPNFDSMDAWPFLIILYGSTSWYNTAIWESLHRHFCKLKEEGNNKNIEKRMLVLNAHCITSKHNENSAFFNLGGIHRQKLDFDFVGKFVLYNPDLTTKSLLRDIGVFFVSNLKAWSFSGIFLNSYIYHVPFYGQITFSGCSYLCQILLLLHIVDKTKNGYFLKVQKFSLKTKNLGLVKIFPKEVIFLPVEPSLIEITTSGIHVITLNTNTFLNTWANK